MEPERGIDAELCSCSALRQATRNLTRHYDAALASVGLGLNQYAILARLQRFGPMRMGDLAGRLVMDRSTLGHLLRPLEGRGLVEMRVDGRDRRSRLVALTPDGELLSRRARPLWQDVETRFAAAFGAEDARSLRATLKRLEAVKLEEPTS